MNLSFFLIESGKISFWSSELLVLLYIIFSICFIFFRVSWWDIKWPSDYVKVQNKFK